MKKLVFIISTLLVFLIGCSSNISSDEAIDIASNIIPPDYRSLAQPRAYFDEEQGQNGIWTVNLEKLNITREELEQFGWQEGDNVSFGNTSPGTNTYYGVLIYIDGKIGEILSQKAIDIWLGPGPPEVVSSGLTIGWIILIVVASLIFTSVIGWFWWRKMRVSSRH